MALQTKYLRLVKSTSTGVQPFTGVGFRGKALLLWTTWQTAAGATTGSLISLGITDGILQACRFIHHPGGEAATTSAQAESDDYVAYKVTATSGATPTVLVAGAFDGWTDDGFDIDWVTNDSDAAVLHAVVIGGDTVQAEMSQLDVTCNAGESLDASGVSFRPSAYVVMGGAANDASGYNLGAPFGSFHGLGFSNAVDNVCGWTLGLGTGGAADCYKGQHTSQVASVRGANVANAPVGMGGRITANLDDGYTFTRDTEAFPVEPVQHVLCLKGVRFALGSFTAPLTATTQAVTLPFEPDLVVLQSLGATASESMAGLGISIGAWQREDLESGGVWIGGVDAANPSEYRRSTYEDLVIETRNASGGAAVMQATVDATDDESITFDFSAVSGSADAIIYMALAPTATIRGSFVAGEQTTVRAARAAAFGLNGEVNEHTEEGVLKVFGNHKVAGQYSSVAAYNATSGAAATIDFDDSNEHILTLTDDCALTFANPVDGGRYALLLVQDGSGSHTVTWPANVRWAAGVAPTLTVTAGYLDLTTFMYVASIDRYIAAWNLNYDPS